MQGEMIRVEFSFEEFCQCQHALEQRVEASTAAFAALVSAEVLPAELLRTSQEQIAAANRALTRLQRSLATRRFCVRVG